MQTNLFKNRGSSIYPGTYVPLFEDNEVNEKLKDLPVSKRFVPSVTVRELTGSYKIEVAVPGVNRENFLINSYGNMLSISVIHDDDELVKQESFQLHEFNSACCFNRKILLADNADPVFIRAEYKAGVLRLYIAKSTHPLNWVNSKIAVF